MPWLALFAGSLLGSAHCAAMCGGFAAHHTTNRRGYRDQALYHCGRLMVYIALGMIVGQIGSSLNAWGSNYLIPQCAAILSGAILIASAVFQLRGKRIQLPRSVAWLSARIVRMGMQSATPFLLGASTAFLPCGWLYVYLAAAASESSPQRAAAVMFLFWLGTVPALLAVSGAATLLGRRYLPALPGLSALILLVLGFGSLWMHVAPLQAAGSNQPMQSCH